MGACYFLAAQGFLAPAIFLPGLTATRSATALPSWSMYFTLPQSPGWMSAALIALPALLIVVLLSTENVHSPSLALLPRPSLPVTTKLSAAADFTVSQVVDRTVGVHGVIAKSHFPA